MRNLLQRDLSCQFFDLELIDFWWIMNNIFGRLLFDPFFILGYFRLLLFTLPIHATNQVLRVRTQNSCQFHSLQLLRPTVWQELRLINSLILKGGTCLLPFIWNIKCIYFLDIWCHQNILALMSIRGTRRCIIWYNEVQDMRLILKHHFLLD